MNLKRTYFLYLLFFLSPVTNAQESIPLDKEHPGSYIKSLLDRPSNSEEYQVDCSNILEFIRSYLEINKTYRALLSSSLHRFQSDVLLTGCGQVHSKKQVIEGEINGTLFFMEPSEEVLLSQEHQISEKLNQCLPVQADCSNILEFDDGSYLDVMGTYRTLLSVSAQRFKSNALFKGCKQIHSEKQVIEEDINRTLFFINSNEEVLSERESYIWTKLSQCLSLDGG